MTRNLKLLGLALAVVLAFSAISASGASAETKIVGDFWCDGYPCKVHGVQKEKHQVIGGLGSFECNEATFDGTPIAAASVSLTMHPIYKNCIVNPAAGEDRPATVTVNGCYYTYTVHFHQTANGEGVTNDEYSGQMHLICPEGVKGIETHVYNDPEHKELRCTYLIEPQTNSTGVDYKDTTTSAVELNTTEMPTKMKRTSGSLLQCGAAEQTIKYKGIVEAKIQNEGGATTTGGITTKS